MPTGIYKRNKKEKERLMKIGKKYQFKMGHKLSKEQQQRKIKSRKWYRPSEETKSKMKKAKLGEKHWNWQGGKSFEPYGLEFNEDLKEVIRNRDRRKCVICEKTELENGEKLTVHHIDYEKLNNNPNNLISLCHSCHSKTNYNKDYWINYFKQN